ncbi:MFS transporter [Micrococcales bacterium 31B]|nr:MFS transporter [Micrococcales bacterium 31B]
MSTTTNAHGDNAVSTREAARKRLPAIGIGNLIEWYDWNVYALFSTFLAGALFSKADPTSALLSTLAVFAVGFVARPFGGFLIGWFSDKYGRKPAMNLTVIMGAGGSFLIALIPSYASIGAAAGVLLVVARLAQGLAHGGELPSAQTYIAEVSPRHRRGLWSSVIYGSGTLGIVFATLLGAVLGSTFSSDFMDSWGWRIPFLIGGVLGLVAVWLRRTMKETETFENNKETAKRLTLRDLFREIGRNPKPAISTIAMTCGLTVIYYVWAVNAVASAISIYNVSKTDAMWAGLGANIVFIVSLPLWGMLSDRVGRRPVVAGCLAALVVLTLPMTAFLNQDPVRLFICVAIMCFLLGGPCASMVAMYAEMFPAKIRSIGFGIPYAIAVAAFGGTAPYLQKALAGAGHSDFFNYYMMLLGVVSIVAVLKQKETAGRDLNF